MMLASKVVKSDSKLITSLQQSKALKVRYVDRLIYKRTSRGISLNVVYLHMFNSDNIKHVCARERGGKREKGSVCNNERGIP